MNRQVDASPCTLHLSGAWDNVDAWERLTLYLVENEAEGVWSSTSHRPTGGAGSSPLLSFPPQPHANMPGELETVLHEMGLGYLWTWDAAPLYDAGFEMWRPGDETVRTATTSHNGRMLLTLREAGDPHLRAAAVQLDTDVRAFSQHAHLLFVGSAHTRLTAQNLRFW
jgi:hypothetical protein